MFSSLVLVLSIFGTIGMVSCVPLYKAKSCEACMLPPKMVIALYSRIASPPITSTNELAVFKYRRPVQEQCTLNFGPLLDYLLGQLDELMRTDKMTTMHYGKVTLMDARVVGFDRFVQRNASCGTRVGHNIVRFPFSFELRAPRFEGKLVHDLWPIQQGSFSASYSYIRFAGTLQADYAAKQRLSVVQFRIVELRSAGSEIKFNWFFDWLIDLCKSLLKGDELAMFGDMGLYMLKWQTGKFDRFDLLPKLV